MARGFKSIGWAAGVAVTALGCYMISLKVASERAALEEVETRIVLAQRDIRILQTEIGTRGRLEQLEKWNVKVLALSAPAHNQFLEGTFQLATLTAPKKTIDPAAPVVLASAPAPAARPVLTDDGASSAGPSPSELMHVASLREEVPAAAANAGPAKVKTERKALASEGTDAAPAKPSSTTKKTVDKKAGGKTTTAATDVKAARPKGESTVAAKPVEGSAAKRSKQTKDTTSRQ